MRRIRVRVDHGWSYAYTDDNPPKFHNLFLYVMVTNTGGRRVPLTHVGWQWLIDSGERTKAGGILWNASRVEVPLREPVLLEPDGVPHRVYARIGQLLHLLDPLRDDVRPVAFTGGGNHMWLGPIGPLAQRVPAALQESQMRERFDELRAAAKPPSRSPTPGLYSIEPMWREGEGSKCPASTSSHAITHASTSAGITATISTVA